MDRTNLLGSPRKLARTGGHTAALGKLAEPLSEGVVRFFCSGCGSSYELTKAGAEDLVGFCADYTQRYIACTGCPACGDDFESAALKEVGK